MLGSHAIGNPDGLTEAAVLAVLANTLTVGIAAATVTVLAALLLVYGVRLAPGRGPRAVLPFTTIGYAAPGAVLGVGS